MSGTKFKLQITLTEEDKEVFDKIKDELNLRSNAEVVRFLIKRGHEALFGKSKSKKDRD